MAWQVGIVLTEVKSAGSNPPERIPVRVGIVLTEVNYAGSNPPERIPVLVGTSCGKKYD